MSKVKSALLLFVLSAANTCALSSDDSLAALPSKSRTSERVSPGVVGFVDRVIRAADNQKMPFLVIDKKDARVYLFQPDGQLREATAALLGLAIGDASVYGIGKRELSTILPQERTTPAGRFVASLGRNAQGTQVLWVDYDSALSLHAVITGGAADHRAQRLSSATPLDNRISYGCINVPVEFFKTVVRPAFAKSSGVVYILPEVLTLREVFPTLTRNDPP